MKIAVISAQVFPCPPPGYAGLEMIAWQCAEGLASKGHDATLFAPEGSRCDHASLVTTGPAGKWDERQAAQSYVEALKDFDVIVDHSWLKCSYLFKMQGLVKSPVLGVCHAPINTMYQSLPDVEKASFICISQDQANHFEGLFSRKARVCHNGVDLDYYKAMPGIKRTDRFLFLARFSSIKGADIAIEVCKEVGVGLDLVGDTSITNEPDYLKKCQSLCDGKQIKLVGPATRGECVKWFSQAHCLLHPTKRYREPFGLAPVEAMACGCPVIAWNYGACRETIGHGKTGWLVDSFEDMAKRVRLCSDEFKAYPGGRENLRNNCVEHVEEFSIQNMINRYEALCVEAVDTGGW